MRILKSNLLMTDRELEALSKKYTEACGEKTIVLPPDLDPVFESAQVFYLCDGYACEGPCPDFYKHTSNIQHAKNFFQKGDGTFWELKEENRDVAKN